MKPGNSQLFNRKAKDLYGLVQRRDAVRQGFPRYFDGYPCENGHIERAAAYLKGLAKPEEMP